MSAVSRLSAISRRSISSQLSNATDEYKEHCSMSLQKEQAITRRKFCHMQNTQLEKNIDRIQHSILPNAANQIDTTPTSATKKPVEIPAAPVKDKKHRVLAHLRPRKLVYIDDELELIDRTSSADSGFLSRHTSARIDRSSSKGPTECRKKGPAGKSFKNFTPTTKKPENANAENTQTFRRVTRSGAKLSNANKENFFRVMGETNQKGLTKTKKNDSAKDANVSKSTGVKYKGFNPNAMVLSQCNDALNWQDKLRWLQLRRDVGLWVQCCRQTCQKWRYVDEYHDPVDVPEEWFCEMNADKSIASCDIPEVPKSPEIEEDLIENKYNAGSIVWALVKGFPWWPGIVDDCPETMSYYKLSKWSLSPTKYHITFFGEKLERLWVSVKNIKPFNKYRKEDLITKTVFREIDYNDQLGKAYKLAQSALKFSILERLQKFSFVARYENKVTNNSINLGEDHNLNNNIEDTCENVTMNSQLSTEDSIDYNENYVQTSQQTIQKSISTSGRFRAKRKLKPHLIENAVDHQENNMRNIQSEKPTKKNVHWSMTKSSPVSLNKSEKKIINDANNMHNSTSSTYDYALADTMSLIHDTELYETNTLNVQPKVLPKVRKFWEKTSCIKKGKSDLHKTDVSPKIPHKQVKIDSQESTQNYNVLRDDTYHGYTSEHEDLCSHKQLTTFEQLRLRWQQNLKRYTDTCGNIFPV